MTPQAATAQETRVLIVAASATRQAELRAVLSDEPGFSISTAGIADLAPGSQAGVLVIDLDPKTLPSETLSSASRLVLLTDTADPGTLSQILAPGPHAILKRDCTSRQLISAVEAVAAGLTVFDTGAAERILHRPIDAVAVEPGEEELTPRETEVLHMMTAGLTNREIASTLGISEHTVKFHIASIFGKLGTSTRTETVTEGIRRRLIVL